MVGAPLARRMKRRGRAAKRSRTPLDSVLEYARLGWASCPGAHPLREGGRACSCDRLGCPDPGAHPLSPAWQMQATTDTAQLTRWWELEPEANVILPTGRVFDVFDVPLEAGLSAMARMDASGSLTGPVAANGDRVLFYVATRGNPDDEDEWWSCSLDCGPETIDSMPGLRWHCRDSYVLAPPSTLPSGQPVSWLRPPDGRPLPDPVRVLDWLADDFE
ncbi:bifunctional DNA primase/polymerase [Thermostaphylospora chromogena]|uniref:Bifunctional DNA primase/polymerase, N-terminal n=1 Tax=Thermostaphylospora chromogena TaxID=35622 RepID=A0A1H1DGJ6_9ACTN|nr:bifunctional DNA primase/polymerase [Thermostaphylospora chromogena]SDQ75645.1 Bifunctional DNA primase/polymerase, N-terminal [Thermostaphylospora chromogena]